MFYLLCFLQHAYGQQKYLPGYIVLSAGDTLQGLLLDEDWKQNPSGVFFKPSQQTPAQWISVSQATAFHLTATGEHFVARPLQYHLYYKEVEAKQSPIGKVVQDTLFVQQLLQGGGVSLYMIQDQNDQDRFWLENQTGLAELIFYEFYRRRLEGRYLEKVVAYKTQLAYLLSPCKTLSFHQLEYSQRALTKLLSQYLQCISVDSLQATPAKKITIDGSLQAGLLLVPSRRTASYLQVGVRFNLPRSGYRTFFLLQAGSVWNIPEEGFSKAFLITGSAGRYFGSRTLQPYLLGGLGVIPGPGIGGGLFVGGGLGYKKKVHLEVRNGLFYLIRIDL